MQTEGEPVAATAIDIRAAAAGWDAEIYTSTGSEPEELEGWGRPVSTITDGGTKQTVDLNGEEVTTLLIWITKLPGSQEQPGRFQMQISDAKLVA